MGSSFVADGDFYEERYVAFIDILGFSAIVRRSASDQAQAARIYNALQSVGNRLSSSELAAGEIKVTSFSDCNVISAAPTLEGLAYMFTVIGDLTLELLSIGILVRGGVAKGKHHQSDRAVYGPAFLEAYALENSIANVPRVVIDRTVHDDFQLYRRSGPAGKLLDMPGLRYDDDGPAFVDVLSYFSFDYVAQPDGGAHMHRCREAIQRELDAAMFVPRHFEKLRWLAIYWNGRVAAPLGSKFVQLPAMLNLAKDGN